MKKNIKFILLCIIVLIVSLFVFNKTFFKSNYNGFKIPLFTYYKNNNLYSIRTSKSLNNSINKYLNSLEKCDKYYYDKSIDKSIIKYSISDSFIKKISIEYEIGNVCEYLSDLEDTWYKDLKSSDLSLVDYITCKNDNCKSSKKNIDINKFINILKSSKLKKNNNKELSYTGNNKYISIYYTDNNTYSYSIKLYKVDNKSLGVILVLDNELIKSGIYTLDMSVDNLFEKILVN